MRVTDYASRLTDLCHWVNPATGWYTTIFLFLLLGCRAAMECPTPQTEPDDSLDPAAVLATKLLRSLLLAAKSFHHASGSGSRCPR